VVGDITFSDFGFVSDFEFRDSDLEWVQALMGRTCSNSRTNSPLRLRVTAGAESVLRDGHPWLFAQSVREQNRTGNAGELAVIYDRKDRFLALGLFDPYSPLRVRVLHLGQPEEINLAWWSARLRQALGKREGLFDAQTTGYRWIHGESDGWPGLVLDRYERTLVLKLYTIAWLPHLGDVVGLIQDRLGPERIVLRLSRNIQKLASEQFQKRDGQLLIGKEHAGVIVFQETGLRFEADVLRGQKTGFFLDQRENRRQVEALAEGRTVLNSFSFSGGFSLYAARGGARSVTDLDISAHALASGERNFALNQAVSQIARCRREAIRADAFDWLAENRGRHFGLIVLDPPSLAKRQSERRVAIGAYGRLVSFGVQHLSRGGILVACSCSAHVSAEEFFNAVRKAVIGTGRRFEEIQTTRHPADHPASFKAAEYLKAIYIRVG
jgi:23S rRNA (cytosine1962-C5)-methyltransferase